MHVCAWVPGDEHGDGVPRGRRYWIAERDARRGAQADHAAAWNPDAGAVLPGDQRVDAGVCFAAGAGVLRAQLWGRVHRCMHSGGPAYDSWRDFRGLGAPGIRRKARLWTAEAVRRDQDG